VQCKVHAFHTHSVDQILMIISGRLKYLWEGGERACGAGDKILLPAGTLHQSEALEEARSTRSLRGRPRREAESESASRQRTVGGGLSRQPLDQFNDLETLSGRQLEERLQQTEAFDGFARWGSELPVQLRNERGIFHLAPLIGTVMPMLSKREGLALR
jgi:hypothetical protein